MYLEIAKYEKMYVFFLEYYTHCCELIFVIRTNNTQDAAITSD